MWWMIVWHETGSRLFSQKNTAIVFGRFLNGIWCIKWKLTEKSIQCFSSMNSEVKILILTKTKLFNGKCSFTFITPFHWWDWSNLKHCHMVICDWNIRFISTGLHRSKSHFLFFCLLHEPKAYSSFRDK